MVPARYWERMIIGRKDFGFLVHMIDGGHLHATGGYAEDRILENLEYLDH